MINRQSKARDTSAESDADSAQTSPTASEAIRRPIEAAFRLREHLITHLQNSLKPGAKPLTLVGEAVPSGMDAGKEIMAKALAGILVAHIPTSEIVLWRPDLLELAQRQAEKFSKILVTETDLPRKHEFWCSYGPEMMLGLHGNAHAMCVEFLYSTVALDKPPSANEYVNALMFHFPVEDRAIRLDKPPLIQQTSGLSLGRPALGDDGCRLLACLSFREQPFVEDAPADVHFTRPERRRLEREGRTPPTVRVVNLRRTERTDKERDEGSHLTDHQYQCQFLVSAHVRRPNPRMREQRPIWVSTYIKGPQGKPFKPPTRRVTAVKR